MPPPCPTLPLPCSADCHEGTWNNLDPESLREGIVTKQSDVVSFGVMPMDYLFGRPANHGDLLVRGLDQQLPAPAVPTCSQPRALSVIAAGLVATGQRWPGPAIKGAGPPPLQAAAFKLPYLCTPCHSLPSIPAAVLFISTLCRHRPCAAGNTSHKSIPVIFGMLRDCIRQRFKPLLALNLPVANLLSFEPMVTAGA